MTDLDPDALRILELARSARTPSEEDKARIARRLPVALGLSATAASAATAAHAAKSATAAKSTSWLAAFKWWIGGSAVLATTVASYIVLSKPSSLATRKTSPRMPPAPAVQTAEPLAKPESPPAQQPAIQTGTEPQPERSAGRVGHQRLVVEREAHGAELGAELDLLHRAQSAWRAREPSRALSLLAEHRTRYPHSQLQIERDALQVLTLCELGRKDDAARLARSVIDRAPRSPLRASLEQSCALK